MAIQTPSAAPIVPKPVFSTIALTLLFSAEILTLSLLHSGDRHINQSLHALYFYIRQLSLAAMLIPACFAILTWLNWARISEAWVSASVTHNQNSYLRINLGLFCILVATIVAIGELSEPGKGAPNWTFWPFLALATVTMLSMVATLMPPLFWLALWREHKFEAAIAFSYSGIILIILNVMQRAWEPLSTITLHIVDSALRLIETNIEIDFESKDIYFRDFAVRIDAQCSGYEGIGLILSFLTIFLYTMRNSLRFPNALILLPLGVLAIWLLNALRVIILVCLGGYISPTVAIDGFHSQAGWLAFLAVTVGTMWLGHRSPFFCLAAALPEKISTDRPDDLTLAYLAPFMALLAAGILASTAAPYQYVFYPLVPLFVGLAIWNFRTAYIGIFRDVSIVSVVVGFIVGVLWVATYQSRGDTTAVATWLHTLPIAAVVGWVTLRGLGTILFVPIAEELAFRGYFHRALQSRDWQRIPIGQVSILAFLVTSICFGLLHQRWLAGALAGAVFALLMYRSRRLSDPIAAHMTANAVIFITAIAWARWDII